MDKNAIKKYAIWAREELIKRVSTKAEDYEIRANTELVDNIEAIGDRILTATEKKQRAALIRIVKDKGFEQAMEEAAYTWFNRFIALRFMEVNGYLPSKVRIFTDDENNFKPQILNEAIHMELEGLDLEKVLDFKEKNKNDELYKYLIITQCNALHSVLPKMFPKIDDYTQLLFPDNILREGSAIEQMIAIIPEEDWKDAVQILGWLYQYYNTELNAVVYDGKMSKSRITKELLPAATTMYTPDWAIKYMVENSLGRIAVDKFGMDPVSMGWKYYLEEAEQTEEVENQLKIINSEQTTLEELKVIDPCMGSGHILVYAFDVLVQIYESQGYTVRDAVVSIIKNNLFGLDIDERAYQFAYFALMMKARSYDRRFLGRDIVPNIYYPKNDEYKEYGSILKIDKLGEMPKEPNELTLFNLSFDEKLNDWNFERLIHQKYDVVITNPPYLGSSRFSSKLDKYVKDSYPDVKSDLSIVMLRKAVDDMCKPNGYVSFITTTSWMFLSSFEKLRKHLLDTCYFSSLVDFGTELFDGKVGHNPIVAWVNRKAHINTKFTGVRLVDYCYSRRDEKEPEFFNLSNHYTASQESLSKIPGSPIAYWVSEIASNLCGNSKVFEDYATTRAGMITGNNNIFIRLWHEIDYKIMGILCKSRENAQESKKRWFPYNKGGEFRKWYGNNEYVVHWENDGHFMRNFKDEKGKIPAHAFNLEYIFKENITWSSLTSYKYAARYTDFGFLYDASGSFADVRSENLYYTLAFLCSEVTLYFLQAFNPTLNFQKGNISSLPFIIDENRKPQIETIVKQNVALSKIDWDSFESSWDFVRHPLVERSSIWAYTRLNNDVERKLIELAFIDWEDHCQTQFEQLKANEEELNRIFIDIYGLQDEITLEVEDKDVTVRLADKTRDVKSFISYAVGCMFGRYSLDVDGLAFAGGKFDRSKYTTFIPDADNVIPICDDEYFEDDIMGRFVDFVKVVYGAETLEQNLDFIAGALGGKGTSREVIRNYFLNGFYADHCKVYSKRPIYWQLESGKKNGFKALIYMHRYEPDTMARVRTDYVHEQQGRYRTAITDLERRIVDASTSERVKLTKQLTKLKDQDTEIRIFEEKVHHLADQMIKIDLDDGVKNNYEIFKDVLSKIK